MTFTPAETYEHLLMQTRAMHTIISCMEQTRSAGAAHEIAYSEFLCRQIVAACFKEKAPTLADRR